LLNHTFKTSTTLIVRNQDILIIQDAFPAHQNIM